VIVGVLAIEADRPPAFADRSVPLLQGEVDAAFEVLRFGNVCAGQGKRADLGQCDVGLPACRA
jgi:hypothetical protein